VIIRYKNLSANNGSITANGGIPGAPGGLQTTSGGTGGAGMTYLEAIS